MHDTDSFPTLSERINSWGLSARSVVKDADRKAKPETIDPASVPRTQSVMELIEAQIKGTMKRANGKRLTSALSRAIDSITEDLSFEGVQLRHPQIWFLHPIEVVTEQVAAMKYRNLQLRQVIDEQLLRSLLAEAQDLDPDEIPPKDISTPVKLRKYIGEVFYDFEDEDEEEKSTTPFADRIEELLYDRLYLPLDPNSKRIIEKTSHISVIYDTLTERFREVRKPNDGKVQYRTVWSLLHLQQFYELYDRLGGVDGAASGIACKHIGNLFEIVGSRFGILDRVPEDERVQLPDGNTARLRMHLRSMDTSEFRKGTNPIKALMAERNYYRSSDEGVHIDYASLEDVLDDGWALD